MAQTLANPAQEQPWDIAGGNNVREHLANERTYLAWIRTSITVVGLGFVIARFGVWLRYLSSSTGHTAPSPHSGYSVPMGALIVIIGALLALLGAWRYRSVRRAIDRQGRAAAGPALVIVTVLVVLFTVGLLFIIFHVT